MAALLAAALGCGDHAPREAPYVAAKPIPRPEAASLVTFDFIESLPQPVPLPPVEPSADEQADSPRLLPPVELPLDGYTEWFGGSREAAAQPPLSTDHRSPVADQPSAPQPASDRPSADDAHNSDARQLLREASAAATGLPTSAVVTERAQAKIRCGYALAQRGANFAARSEFLEVLRMLAEAKDRQHGAARRTLALTNGLRALDEAADFAPRGSGLDSPGNLKVVLSSHRTPVAQAPECEALLPQQLADMYYRYAQVQLGAAVAGEPAGSMALHGLGKLYNQIARVEPEKCPSADRRAFTLQQAALLARDDNHLAAHELGVLLAEAGHYRESEILLAQVAAREPNPVVFRNLARVQRKLGREQAAQGSDEQARMLAERDRSASGPVVWVAPEALARTPDAAAATSMTTPMGKTPATPQPAGRHDQGLGRPPMSNVTRLPGGWMR
ncbi:MAG: hypothetical protein DCC67_16770 [Planctomycetota bacterium]|nr:MAG: hypothetical protein DCC67_16770 [Planctomycetota bacterium]